MALPPVGFEKEEVKLSGGVATVRGLSYAEGQKVRGPDAVVHAISAATDTPFRDAKDWVGNAPAGDIKRLMEAINRLSGFDDDAQFPDRQGDVPGPASAAE